MLMFVNIFLCIGDFFSCADFRKNSQEYINKICIINSLNRNKAIDDVLIESNL